MAIADFKNSEKSLNNGHVHRVRNENADQSDDKKKDSKKLGIATTFLLLKLAESGSQMNMKGVYLHIITDFIGSVIVIFTASISLWFPEWTIIKLYMDPVLSMIMGKCPSDV